MRQLLLPLLLGSLSFAGFAQTASYCVPTTWNGNSGGFINAVQLGTINNITGRDASPYYTSFVDAPAPNQTTDLAQGRQERIIISLSGGEHVNAVNNAYVWIDYNQDGDFDDAGELVGSGSHRFDGDVVLTFTVPVTALPGATRLRVRCTDDEDGLGPCEPIYDSEAEDYRVTIVVPTPCAGTPALGTTVTSNAGPLCSGMSFNLSVDPYPVFASGTTYQWQVSTAGAGGTFTAIAGQTYPTATITGQMQSSWYRLAATCVTSGLSGVSSPVNVTQQPDISACYCMPLNLGDNTGDYIQSVQLGTINNVSGRNTSVYTSYVSAPAPNLTTSLIQGSQQAITITGVSSLPTEVIAWIDFNGDGDFNDAGEQVADGFIDDTFFGTSFTRWFNVPLTAVAGATRMRLRSTYSSGFMDPCAATKSGETEDYIVTIVTPCSVQPVTTTITAGGPTSFCQGNSVILTASGADTYLWSNGATTSSITVADAGTYSVTGTNTVGCSNTSNPVTVKTGTPANAGTNGTLTVCEGTTLMDAQLFAALGGSPAAGGSWSPARTGAGTYTYTVAPTPPCKGTATATVTVTTINKTINAGCYAATITRMYNQSANATTFTYNACANGCASLLGYIAFITQSNTKVLTPLNGATYKTARNSYTVSVPVGTENGKMVYGIKYSVVKGTGIKNKGECDDFTFTLAGNIPVDAITVRFKAGTLVTSAVATCPLQSSVPVLTTSQTTVKEQASIAALKVIAYPNPFTSNLVSRAVDIR